MLSYIVQYITEICFLPGEENDVADTLSKINTFTSPTLFDRSDSELFTDPQVKNILANNNVFRLPTHRSRSHGRSHSRAHSRSHGLITQLDHTARSHCSITQFGHIARSYDWTCSFHSTYVTQTYRHSQAFAAANAAQVTYTSYLADGHSTQPVSPTQQPLSPKPKRVSSFLISSTEQETRSGPIPAVQVLICDGMQ